jgi:hypothetical protein
VFNNPILYIDPSGYIAICLDGIYCGTPTNSSYQSYTQPSSAPEAAGGRRSRGIDLDTDQDGIPNYPDPDAPATTFGRGVREDCIPGNLVECYYNRGIMPAGDYKITLSEYFELLEAISIDIDKQGPLVNYNNRAAYDTPFYNGGGSGGGDVELQGTICIDEIICSSRTEMNYIAQGQWSAGAMENPLMSTMVVNSWKLKRYHRLASFETNLHNNIGYYYYMFNNPGKFILTSLGITNTVSFPIAVAETR